VQIAHLTLPLLFSSKVAFRLSTHGCSLPPEFLRGFAASNQATPPRESVPNCRFYHRLALQDKKRVAH
jgi:hypothetical protein